ncbi:MAG: hypothetical protein ACYTXE_45245 [Nostoc sp.]
MVSNTVRIFKRVKVARKKRCLRPAAPTPHLKEFLEEKLGVRRQAFAVGDRFLYWINWYYAKNPPVRSIAASFTPTIPT